MFSECTKIFQIARQMEIHTLFSKNHECHNYAMNVEKSGQLNALLH